MGGYLSLLFTSFAAEALDGEVTAWVILVAFGRPALAFLSAAVAGLCTTLVMARWMSRTAPMARFSPWVIGLATAALGAAAAVIVFLAAMAAVDTVGSQSDNPRVGERRAAGQGNVADCGFTRLIVRGSLHAAARAG